MKNTNTRTYQLNSIRLSATTFLLVSYVLVLIVAITAANTVTPPKAMVNDHHHHRHKHNQNCRETSRSRLDQLLLEGIRDHMKLILEGIEIYPSVQRAHANLTVNATELDDAGVTRISVDGQVKCWRSNATAWDVNRHELSTCPYHFELFRRVDRYPFDTVQAVCNPCPTCNHVSNASLDNPRCGPDYVVRPVLIRSSSCNAPHNHWSWQFRFERVPAFCSCKNFVVYNGGN